MLSIEMECGVCAAAFSISMTEDDFQDTAWLMAQRYMNAHALSCNYATPMPGVSTDEDDEEQGS